MTEDCGWFYTNTFAVKDPEAFQSFCSKYGLETFKEESHIGCFHDELGLPQIAEACDDELSFLRELASYLRDGYVAIAVDARVTQREHCPTSWQITYAVNNTGVYREVNPSSIFLLAREIGSHIMSLQDMCSPEHTAFEKNASIPLTDAIENIPGEKNGRQGEHA